MLWMCLFPCLVEHFDHETSDPVFCILVFANTDFDSFKRSVWFLLDCVDRENLPRPSISFEFGASGFNMACTGQGILQKLNVEILSIRGAVEFPGFRWEPTFLQEGGKCVLNYRTRQLLHLDA